MSRPQGARIAVLGPLLAALVAAAGIAWGLASPPNEPGASRAPQASVTAEATALLGGLTRGDTLVGWHVTAIAGPDETGMIRIDVTHRKVTFALMLVPLTAPASAPLSPKLEAPPVQTEHWAIYYGHVDPPSTQLPRNVIHATTNALANLVRQHE